VSAPADPLRGLPEPLPPGERILWQGAPDWRILARSTFHTRGLVFYFVAILIARGITVWSGEHSAERAAIAVLWLAPLPVLALAMLYTMAWLIARTTVYTVTTRRVVMHIGVVLDLTLNLQFQAIEGAALRKGSGASGDIAVTLSAPNKIAYVHLWPHARPWQIARPQPLLRSIPDVAAVGAILAEALAAVCEAAPPVAARTPEPVGVRETATVRMPGTRPQGLVAAS
jgi:hypothetical protein